jgi:hypothetical protein
MVTAVDSRPLPRLTKCGLSACTFTVFAGSDNLTSSCKLFKMTSCPSDDKVLQ